MERPRATSPQLSRNCPSISIGMRAGRIVFLVHYFPPINNVGSKRVEAMSKYFARSGRSVTVITTRKSARDGEFTERLPEGVEVYEIDRLGRRADSQPPAKKSGTQSAAVNTRRTLKSLVMRCGGQLPDPRLPFAVSIVSPFLAPEVRRALKSADVVIGSCPPWPTLLAALLAGWRFKKPVVLDYRDHFSECHEMPGGRLAKFVERQIDRALAKRADGIVAISEPMARYYARFNPRVGVVRNGYDPELIQQARKRVCWEPRPESEPLTVRYLGLITPDRVPENLLKALAASLSNGRIRESSIRFEFYGECSVLEDALRRRYPLLLKIFVFRPPVSYQQALDLMVTSDHLLFSETSYKDSLSAQGILTTKLFEYLAAGRPVIADIDPEMLAGQVIRNAGSPHFVSDRAEAFEGRLTAPEFWQPAESTPQPTDTTLSRVSQAQQYLSELDDVCLRSASPD